MHIKPNETMQYFLPGTNYERGRKSELAVNGSDLKVINITIDKSRSSLEFSLILP